MIDAVAGSWSECATALTNSPATAVRFWLSVASSAQPRTATCDRYALAATADAARGAKRASAATDLQAFDRRVCDQFPVRMRSSLRQRCGISSDRTPTAFGASGESCPSSPVDRQRAASSSRRGGGKCPGAFWSLPPHTPRLNSPLCRGGRQAFHHDIRARVQTNGPSR